MVFQSCSGLARLDERREKLYRRLALMMALW